MKNFFTIFLLALFYEPNSAYAFLNHPEKTAVGVNTGNTYDPSPAFFFSQFCTALIYDYEEFMPHHAPDALKFKIEGNVGAADFGGAKLLASLNIYAMYYLDFLETEWVKPYIEGGIGVVFNDFRVDGMGLRTNFNPQAGFGFEWPTGKDYSWFTALHATHISNANLNDDNRGINGVLLQVGVFFYVANSTRVPL